MTYVHSSRRTRLVATSAAGLLAAAGTLATAAPAAADPACNTVEALMSHAELAKMIAFIGKQHGRVRVRSTKR